MKKARTLLEVMLAVMVVIAMTACGEESKTKALFEKIDKDTGIHMKYALKSGDKTEMDVYIKGDNAYVDVDLGGKHSITILKGDEMTVLDPQTKTGTKMTLTDDQKKSLEQLTKTPESMKDTADQDDFKTDTQKIDGMEYDVEIFEKDDKKATFVYNDDGELVFIISDDGNDEVSLEVKELNGDVKDSQFDVPSDYTVTEVNQNGGSTGAGTGTGTDTGNSGTGSTNSSSASDDGTPIGGDGTVVCKDGAFKFKTDSRYIAVVNGKYVDIYLEKKSTVPFFNCYKFTRVNDQSADEFLDGVIKQVKKSKQNKLAGEPEKQTITVNGEKVRGIKYVYSTDDGKATVTAENFAVIRGDNIYSWGSAYMTGDNVTPAEVQGAMDSFEEMR